MNTQQLHALHVRISLEIHFSFLFSVATATELSSWEGPWRRGGGRCRGGGGRGGGAWSWRRRDAAPSCVAALSRRPWPRVRGGAATTLPIPTSRGRPGGERARRAGPPEAGGEHPPCGSTHARPASALTGSEHARRRRAGTLAAGTNVGSEHGEPSERTHRKRARTPATPGEPARLRRERTPAASTC